MDFITNNWLLILVVIVLVVAVVLWMRRRGATDVASSTSNAVKSTASTASSMATSATSAVKDTTASAGSMAAGAATGAASLTKDAASGAGSMVKDAGNSAGGAMAGTMGAVGAAAGAMDMGQMTDVLGGIMNGNVNVDANSPLGRMIMPMADNLTAKLGIPKEVGAMVVAFALAKLAELMKAKQAGTGAAPMPGGMNVDQVLGKINSADGIDTGSLNSLGLTSEVSKKTGLSEEQAGKSLQMALGEISAGLSGKTSYDGMSLPDMSMLQGLMK